MIIFKTESISRCDTLKKNQIHMWVITYINIRPALKYASLIMHWDGLCVFLHNSQDLRWEVIPGHEQNVILKTWQFGYSYACIIILKDRVFWGVSYLQHSRSVSFLIKLIPVFQQNELGKKCFLTPRKRSLCQKPVLPWIHHRSGNMNSLSKLQWVTCFFWTIEGLSLRGWGLSCRTGSKD